MTGASLFSQLSGTVEVVTAIVIVVILASSLDDLFIDVRYWARRIAAPLGRRAAPAPITAQQARSCPEHPFVIMVPAWQESGVIGRMLEALVDRLEYANFMVFVGTYPNDPQTCMEVDRVALRDPRVVRVEVSHPGPTCKADCLNEIFSAMLDHERDTGSSFSAAVLHDSEDVLHPLELKYFNAMLGQYHMIQLPVVALGRRWSEWIAGTYMDEFAEAHGKDMPERQHLSGHIPSAGVATCFSRAAMLALCRQSMGVPFRTDSLTEDYEVGMRLASLGLRSRFLLLTVEDEAQAGGCGSDPLPRGAGRMLAVCEYFPSRFRAAYRQKARWMLGIGLQAWQQLPLRGQPWGAVYLMLHDRKGVVTSFAPIAAYAVLLYFLVFQWGAAAGWWPQFTPTLLRAGGPWQALLYVNGGLVVVRASQRAYFTGRLYGWLQGVVSLPRMVVGNLVNCAAAARAWRLFLQHRMTGKPLAWDKTAHEYPATEPRRALLPAPAMRPREPVAGMVLPVGRRASAPWVRGAYRRVPMRRHEQP